MSKGKQIATKDYAVLLAEVKERVRAAQYEALRAVNKELVGLYWDIGKMIVARQTGKSWGKAVVERLATDLRKAFPGVSGFSSSNLWRMRNFFESYATSEKLAPLVREISWSHNIVIMEGCSEPLERALIGRIEDFLRAMGGLYAFVGSQFRLEVENTEYFIDLLLFHRRLRCLVAIELKIGEFQPEFVGKMQFYLTALDQQVREEGENPSIGIILCKEKKRTIVEYALHSANKPIGVATYQIVRQLPKELKGELPDPEEITKLLNGEM